MNDLLKKLNCTGQDPVIVLNAPAEFNPTLQASPVAATVHNVTGKLKASRFAVFFATEQRVVDATIKELARYLKAMLRFGSAIRRAARNGTPAISSAIRVGPRWARPASSLCDRSP